MPKEWIIDAVKWTFPAILSIIGLVGAIFIAKVYRQKKINEIEELTLLGKKINFETHSKPLSDLVDESNKEHGAGAVEPPTGEDPKKD